MVAITKHGARRLAQLGPVFEKAQLYVSEKHLAEVRGVPNTIHSIKPPFGEAIGSLFRENGQLVLVFSIGAAFRLLAPHLRSKEVDPGVVVIDDAGRFVVPILSGHWGGANAFALKVASSLGAQPVLTTASEALGTLPVDILGRELGWKVDAPKKNLVQVAAHVVNDEPIAILQECGPKDWWQGPEPLPDNIHLFTKLDEITLKKYSALLWITRKPVDVAVSMELGECLVIYRPPSPLVVGVGCDRGTSQETIRRTIEQALEIAELNIRDVCALTTVDKKGDEEGLLALVAAHHWTFHTYSSERLATIEVPHPSEVVLKYVGTPSVSEAAAILAAGASMGELLIEKHKYCGEEGRNATVSIVALPDHGEIVQ